MLLEDEKIESSDKSAAKPAVSDNGASASGLAGALSSMRTGQGNVAARNLSRRLATTAALAGRPCEGC
jgi:hypothetical protein